MHIAVTATKYEVVWQPNSQCHRVAHLLGCRHLPRVDRGSWRSASAVVTFCPRSSGPISWCLIRTFFSHEAIRYFIVFPISLNTLGSKPHAHDSVQSIQNAVYTVQ